MRGHVRIDAHTGFRDGLIRRQSHLHLAAFEHLQVAVLLGQGDRLAADVGRRHDRLHELRDARPRSCGKLMPSADAVAGKHAETHIILAHRQTCFKLLACDPAQLHAAGAATWLAIFQEGLRDRFADNAHRNIRLAADRHQRVGLHRLFDGDLHTRRTRQVREGQCSTRQEAWQMQARHEAEHSDD